MTRQPPRQLSVLHIEDNPADARLVREMLSEEGPESIALTQVPRLREALEALKTRGFNAILLDLTLPDAKGMETFERVRAAWPEAVIIVLTGLADTQMAASVMYEGAQDYLVKGSVDGKRLYECIHHAVERDEFSEALRRSESRYRSLVHGSIQGILIHIDGIVLLANPALAKLFGIARGEDFIGTPIWPFIAPEDRAMVAEYMRTRSKGSAPSQYEFRAVRRDGNVIWLSCIVTTIQWDGRDAVLATMVDVTERREAEDHLRASEERFRELVENIKEAFVVVDLPSLRISYVSPAWEEITGRRVEDAYGAGGSLMLEMSHPDDRHLVMATQSGLSRGEPATVIFRLLRPDGSPRWVRARRVPVRDKDGRAYRVIGLLEDITEGRRTEDQLRQAQKLEALGQLAGGVAHDLNNVLTAILGFTALRLADTAANDPAGEDLMEIRNAGNRAAALTRQLLAFSRKQVLEPRVVDVNEVVEGMAAMLRRLIAESIDLSFSLAPEVGAIQMDPTQLEQIVINLTVNAADAMPRGGRLTVETANVVLDEHYQQHHPAVTPGDYVMLAVSDNGVGMDEATSQRIFEPFFTTKEVGRGTGLGLSTVHGIVKQSGGDIWVYSQPGVGTTFKVYLPRDTRAELLAKPPAISCSFSNRCMMSGFGRMKRVLRSVSNSQPTIALHAAANSSGLRDMLPKR